MESRKAEKPVIQPIQLSLLGRRKVGGGAWTADRKQRAQQVFADRGLVGPWPRLLGSSEGKQAPLKEGAGEHRGLTVGSFGAYPPSV